MRKIILIITGVFYPEPIVSANLLRDLAMELSEKYDVVVLRPHPSRPMGFSFGKYEYDGFPFKVVEVDSYVCPASSVLGRFKESFSFGKVASAYIEQHHGEIGMIYNAPWHLFGRKTVAKTAQKYGIPYMTPVQDVYPEALLTKVPDVKWIKSMLMSVLLPIDRYALSHAIRIHTISEAMAAYLAESRRISIEKFLVVRNWQDETPFVGYNTIHTDKPSGDFTFMYLGNVGPLAGIDFLFEAFRRARLMDARLIIAGSGSARERLREMAETEYADCKIEFWDVPNGMVPATQAKADIMLLPVRRGGAQYSIPSKLPAYMFSAKPILASVDADCDTADCIKKSGGGWLAVPEDPESIAYYMSLAYRMEPSQRNEMGMKGFRYAMEHLSKGKNLKKLARAVTELIDPN